MCFLELVSLTSASDPRHDCIHIIGTIWVFFLSLSVVSAGQSERAAAEWGSAPVVWLVLLLLVVFFQTSFLRASFLCRFFVLVSFAVVTNCWCARVTFSVFNIHSYVFFFFPL